MHLRNHRPFTVAIKKRQQIAEHGAGIVRPATEAGESPRRLAIVNPSGHIALATLTVTSGRPHPALQPATYEARTAGGNAGGTSSKGLSQMGFELPLYASRCRSGRPEIRFKFPHPDHLKALWGGMIDGRLCRR